MSEAVQPALVAEHLDRKNNHRLPRRRFFYDMPDKGLFGLMALAGFVLILGLKTYGVNAHIVTGLAILGMVGYGFVAYRMPAIQLRLDRLGDNFYYLGFIYTLASMSAAILQISGGEGVDALIGSFGIALFTTIVGVAGRVLFVQMRSELDEIESAVRRDLLATSNELRSQLALSLRDFETFHIGVKQATEESLKNTLNDAERYQSRLDAVFNQIKRSIEEAFAPNRIELNRIDQLIEQISKSTKELTHRIDRIEVPAGRVIEGVEKFDKQVQTVFANLEKELQSLMQRVHMVVSEAAKPSDLVVRVEQLLTQLNARNKEPVVRPVIDERADRRRRKRRWFWPFGRGYE